MAAPFFGDWLAPVRWGKRRDIQQNIASFAGCERDLIGERVRAVNARKKGKSIGQKLTPEADKKIIQLLLEGLSIRNRRQDENSGGDRA